MTDEAPPRPPITVRGQCMVVGTFTLLASGLHLWWILEFPEAYREGRHALPSVLMTIVLWLGQGVWITMDRRRHGLEVGFWRFAAFLGGPVAVGFHILLLYRLRALYVLPLAAIPYGFFVLVPILVALILGLLPAF